MLLRQSRRFTFTSVQKTPLFLICLSNFFRALTCRETLIYAALIKLSDKTMISQTGNASHKVLTHRKIQRADQILRELGLVDCANTLVGNELLKGLSGGEKRRLSIGVQMLNDPQIFVM